MSYLPSSPHATLLDVFKRYPDLARPLHDFAQALMRGPSPLAPGERELIAAYVSALNECGFCRASHAAAAGHFGVPAGRVEELLAGIDGAGVEARLKPLLHYVRKLNERPAAVTPEDLRAVFDAGWDEDALVHAAVICGFFNLMNRWVEGLGIESDPGVVRMAGRMLHDVGYGAISTLLAGEGKPERG
ncbi:MAG: carboxymuconolactone decarboxylase family protein [Kiloniellaceae bacterium]